MAKKSFEQPAPLSSASEGISLGYEYPQLEDALSAYGRHVGQLSTDEHTANYFRALRDQAGQPLGKTTTGTIGRKSGEIQLRQLRGSEYPVAVANAANKVLLDEQMSAVRQQRGIADPRGWLPAFNQLFRSVTGTFDDSVVGIQGLLTLARDPRVFGRGMKVNFWSWADKKRLGAFLQNFDDTVKPGRLGTTDWAKYGVSIASVDPEFAPPGLLERLPFGRVFSNTRTAWALGMARQLEDEALNAGKMLTPADYRDIAQGVNRLVGIVPKSHSSGDSVLDMLLYAPGWLQARLQTVANAAIAPVTVPAAAVGIGRATYTQKLLARSFYTYTGFAIAATIAANEAQGEETDFRPMDRGRPNPNFMRIKWGQRDFSLLGPWDSLLRASILVGTGKPHEALRSLGSGTVQVLFDTLTGETPVRTGVRDNPEQFGQYVAGLFSPFSLEEVPGFAQEMYAAQQSGDAERMEATALAAVAELFGAKTTPYSFGDYADKITRRDYGISWTTLLERRDRLEEQALAQNKASSPELTKVQDIMDKIEEEVDKQRKVTKSTRRFPLTLAARRDVIARERYGEPYDSLYLSQQLAVNRAVSLEFEGVDITPKKKGGSGGGIRWGP